ncbi:hypothetical protein K2P47_01795 [Patescibacteria group bacterium]|nr:hypothetical protein [Patescibacteria group bacterium]
MKTPIIIGGQKIGRLRASFLLFKESWRFLKADKELLLVPIFSTVFSGILIGLLTLVLITSSSSYDKLVTGNEGLGYSEYIFMFGVYVVSAFSLALAQAIIVHIVYVRAHGGNATLGNGIARAFANWVPLLLWAVITSTVGMALRFISERSALVGRIVAGLLGAAWSILTFFVVPILILQKKTPFTAVSASATLFKKTWGETLVANVTLGLVFMVAHLVVLASFVGLLIYGVSTQNAVLLISSIVGVLLWLLIATLVYSALQGILKTLLYIYAAEDVVPENFNRELLESMLERNTTTLPTASTLVDAPVSDVTSKP